MIILRGHQLRPSQPGLTLAAGDRVSLLTAAPGGPPEPGVQRQPYVLLDEVDLDGALQGQVARGQAAAELPQPGGLARSLVRPDGAADAAVPAPAATASEVLAATAAASTANSPRLRGGLV